MTFVSKSCFSVHDQLDVLEQQQDSICHGELDLPCSRSDKFLLSDGSVNRSQSPRSLDRSHTRSTVQGSLSSGEDDVDYGVCTCVGALCDVCVFCGVFLCFVVCDVYVKYV